MPYKKKQPIYLARLAVIANVIIWGAALPVVKPALAYITSFQFLFLRYLIAAPLLLPIILLMKPKGIKINDILIIIGIESFQIIGQLYLLYHGLSMTTALESNLINAASPIIITLGGILFLKEREEKREWQGLVLGVLGTLIIILSPYLLGQSLPGSPSYQGNLLVLLSTFSWAIYVLLAKKHFSPYPKIFITALSCWLGLVFYGFVNLTTTGLTVTVSQLSLTPVLLAVLYMGILGSPIAVALYLYGQSRIEASEASLLTYLQPVIYIPLAVFWLGEQLQLWQLVGLFLVTGGVIWAQIKKR